MKTEYDIAIVGGGLAGLSLAILSAKAGYRVVLFEKETYPFHKVCSEYISMESFDFLKRIGIPLDEWNLPVIDKLLVTDLVGREYNCKLPLGGFGLSRYKLDNALYQIAIDNGVEVRTGIKIQQINYVNNYFVVDTGTVGVTSLIAIGSFGKRSNLDIKWKRSFIIRREGKLDNYIAVKYHIRYNHPVDLLSIHNFQNGYCGISKIEDNKCCICYLTTGKNLAKTKNVIPEMEEQILYKNPHLKKIFTEGVKLDVNPLSISHINFHSKEQIHNHILLLGDAAGLIPPLCGNGISMAMHTSLLAFTAIESFLQNKIGRREMELLYVRQWNHFFKGRLRTGRWVQFFFGDSVISYLFLQIMHLFPWLAQKIIRATRGKSF